MSAGYSVSLMTSWSGPTVTRLWIKTRLVGGTQEAVSAAHLGAAPTAQPSAVATPEVVQRLHPFGVPGPWSERLPHFRPEVVPGPAGHLQSEYVVPRQRDGGHREASLHR
jgi:xylitol oxidase